MGREGHILRSSQLQQLNRVQDGEVKGTCTRLLGELQSLASNSVSGSHITGSCTPLHAHRLPQCGHLRHSGGQQQQQDCFAASFMGRLPCDHACWRLNESLYRDLCAVNPPLPPCCPPDQVFFTAAFDSLFSLCSAPPS